MRGAARAVPVVTPTPTCAAFLNARVLALKTRTLGTPADGGLFLFSRGKGPGHVHGEHDQHAVDGAEPVRRILRNENPIAFGDVARGSALDRGASQIGGIGSLLVDELAAGHQSGGSVNHVKKLGLVLMDGRVAHRG